MILSCEARDSITLPHLLQLDEECVQNITTIPQEMFICPFSVFTFAPLSKIGEFA